MTRKISLCAAVFACIALFAACNKEYPPVFYQQIYSLDGIRTEAEQPFERGTPVPVPEFKTSLQIMYEAYPDAVKNYVKPGVYRQGAFFEQHGYIRNMGDGIGDMCNHAAWFVMNVAPEANRPALAMEIAKSMVEANEESTLKMLNKILKTVVADGRVKVYYKYYDEDNRELVRKREEIFVGTDVRRNGTQLGLTRCYYESGMISSEVFYRYGTPVGYAFTYFEDGGIRSIRHFDEKSVKTVYTSPRTLQLQEKKK